MLENTDLEEMKLDYLKKEKTHYLVMKTSAFTSQPEICLKNKKITE